MRASRDGGVDAVAVDPDPIWGGKISSGLPLTSCDPRSEPGGRSKRAPSAMS